MPFIARKVEPRYLSRGHVPAAGAVDWPCGAELEAVANGALTASLRQLASLLVAAEDVFAELTTELAGIAERSGRLRMRIDRVEEAIGKVDPKKIPVPESDICTFAQRRVHFHAVSLATPARSLFTLDTRPRALRQLYEAAAAVAVRSLDSLRRERDATTNGDGASALDMFMCTPILGKRRREQSLDIESRVPRAIEELRRWTSAEALGDVTVPPDCASRIFADITTDDRPVDHKLPSPEEQVQAVALKFPAEIVAVDVSGRGFQRMSMRRRSLHTGALGSQQQQQDDGTVKRRSRPRRPRGKRRNTIAGTDQKEIRQAVAGETPLDETEEPSSGSASKRAHRSASTDLLGTGKKDTSPTEKKSHFNTLKAWGRSRLKLISPKSSSQQQNRTNAGSEDTMTSPISGSLDRRSTSRHNASTDEAEDPQLGSSRRARRDASKSHHHERKPSSSSSSGKSVSSQQQVSTHHHHNDDDAQSSITEATEVKDKQQLQLPLHQQQATSQTASRQSSVRLRESAAERRERRKASSRADEPPHSSSGNWSASSESGRASIGSETTTTTHPPRSTTTASIGTSSTSLSHARRLKGRDTSASSSVTSEGTLTPDIIQDINAVPFSDDGETSSVYSCDTEGYYTSFHVDSGLKTLREEEPLTPVGQHQPQQLPQSPLTRSNEVQSDPTSPVAENEYELFGRGSTSTTTSSAGTVCTTLMAPPPPERKSSLTVVAMVHGGQKQNGGESPDSGHNTSSSPVESASSPACTGRSCSEFEYSESSDLEGCERIERIRSKTAINTSRIPSMCVITPPNSDDEQHKESKPKKEKSNQQQQQQQQQQHQHQHQHQQQVLMSATVGTAKMEVFNGQDKNLYATVQTVVATASVQSCDKGASAQNLKISPLSGMLGKLRGVLPGKKNQPKPQDLNSHQSHQPQAPPQPDSGDYVTIADMRNNNDKHRREVAAPNTISTAGVTYANADLFRRDAEYVSLSELPKKPDSSLERRRQGARVTLDSDGKVVYSSDSLRRRKGAHTTFIPGPFVKEGPSSPAPSPLLHRAQITPRAVTRTSDAVDGDSHLRPNPNTNPPEPTNHTTSSQPQQPGKVIIRAAKSPDRDASPDYVRTPATVVGPTGKAAPSRHQGAYVNVQGEEEKVLLVIQSTDTISTSACPQQQQQQQQPQNIHQHQHQQQHQPPPYVGPPQVQAIYEDYTYHQTAAVYNNNRSQGQQRSLQPQLRQSVPLKNNNNNNNNLHHHHQPYHHPNIHDIVDPYQQLIYEKSLQHRQPTYFTENQKLYAQQQQKQQQQQQQLYSKSQSQQQFYTLPNRRAQREVILEPPRSITPDITRGLGRGPLSAMHMLARQGQKSNSAEKLVMHHHGQAGYNCQMDLNKKNLEQFEARCRLAAQQQQQQQKLAPVDVKNRFASPLGLSALGYRFFASPIQDSLKTAPISPIGPEHANGFKSSTPTGGRVAPTVAERLALSSQRCASPNPALMQHNADNKQQLSDSGRSTPTNLILSPIKSTMSNEELFAAIHKSKRRLNIKDDPESLSPAGSVTSLNAKGQQAGTRHSWSPESQKVPEIPKTVLSPSATSRMDFKRLLLQQSIKAGPARISAAEQLKLSRQQCQDSYQQQSPQHQQYQQPQQQSPQKPNQMPLTKVLSPRSAWRFQTPRTDVLSSTIIEDTAAEEKAMKPSPDTPSPVSRLPTTTTRRQLDMSEEKPAKTLEEVKNAINETRSQRSLEKREKELENRLQAIDSSSKKQQPPATDDDAIDPVKAIESRRMSNQLARAQFLASSTPASTSSSSSSAAHKDLFSRRFRARSESPQQNNPQRALTASPTAGDGATVTRSPSAPALETAL